MSMGPGGRGMRGGFLTEEEKKILKKLVKALKEEAARNRR